MKRIFKILLAVLIISNLTLMTVYAEPNSENVVPEEEIPLGSPPEEGSNEEIDTTEDTTDTNEESEDSSVESIENINQENYEEEIIKRPIDTPASVTGEKYSGSGTVMDFTSTGSKAFYTIKARDNSIYYIIIDLDKTEDNVYFLSEINGEELNLGQVSSSQPTRTPTQSTQNKVTEPEESNLMFYMILLIGGAGILVYGYFTKIRPNRKKTDEDSETKSEGETFIDDELESEFEIIDD